VRAIGSGVDVQTRGSDRETEPSQSIAAALEMLTPVATSAQHPVVATADELRQMDEERAAATDAVVRSGAHKRLIVSGPGTGKSFTFNKALADAIVKADGGKGLALTFIRNLVEGLRQDIGEELADVNTFHGYCKYLMHSHVGGLQDADLYPLLMELLVKDLQTTGRRSITTDEIEEHLHKLETDDGLIGDVLEFADYYGAVAFTDIVYRVLEHFRAHEEDIPELPLVVVDEYQDFSLLETTFIELLATKSRVLAAGDDDQALYSNLRYASPQYIRDLANGDEYEQFALPFCSRCTEVVVAAVNDVIATATGSGDLVGRIVKPFRCYLPDKQADSEGNPKLIHVDCSTANTTYAGQYIAQQIARIPHADIEVSRKKGYPTALVIGPNPFLRRAFDVVKEQYKQARMKTSQKLDMDPLDGYTRIAVDEQSRLGWRIVASCNPPDAWKEIITKAHEENTDLRELLPDDYVDEHLKAANLVGALLNDRSLPEEDAEVLCNATGRSIDEIREYLEIEPDEPETEMEEGGEGDERDDEPDILFTTLVGAKGLSAEHVFIVGLNNGHFPSVARAIEDDEVCKFIVALSRTRKRCHLISYRFAFAGWLQKSVFLDWVAAHVDPITVDKDYDFDP
jgi:ATP-dependent DNA helicase UvrD/PcrA